MVEPTKATPVDPDRIDAKEANRLLSYLLSLAAAVDRAQEQPEQDTKSA